MQIRASVLRTLTLWNYLTYLLAFVHTANYQQPAPEDLLYPPDAVQRYAHTEPGSYFGYSVASYVGQSQSFCLVGSPRAKSDILGDLSGHAGSHSSPHTGLVYRIDLDPNLPYCSMVPIATTDEMRQEAGTPYPGFSSWLGGTVAAASNSLDGIQLGCDPRYIYAPDPINRTVPGDMGLSQPRTYLGTGQCALYTGASMQYTSVDACYSQEEGACLAGFSADVKPGKHLGEALVALGMPGSYLTEGNVFLGHYRGRELINAMRLKSSPQDLKHMGFNLGYAVSLVKLIPDTDSKTSHKLHSDASEQTNNFHETNDNWGLLASSSMWIDNEYRGIVMLIDQTMELGGITYLKDQWGHIGSFFGYSLATADLDGNGILDIIVGAPYFTGQKGEEKLTDQDEQVLLKSTKSNRVRDTLTGSIPLDTDPHFAGDRSSPDVKWGRLAPDIGRVYVFYGYPSSSVTNSHLLNRDQVRPDYLSRPPIVLSGLKMPGGRFGHSLVNLGDVDGDGTEDLAISCPYCSDPDRGHDIGAVLIYLGRENFILEDNPFQVCTQCG
ncbi:hypothetical protein P879_01674 [Paragonimus westermani]|uniref:Uncharacterized protein n=1 Tax=Paragonimus westermani TaxID=34504 RepID=A0A8T0DRE0_9TREM|nr:hypothetical protein P879_01674 [Paragonimus westermani]